MQQTTQDTAEQTDTAPDEDGTVLVYGHVVIRDLDSGSVLVSTRG